MRDVRVWLQAGAEDQGMWPLQKLEMASSLQMRGYDFHFSFRPGTHHFAQGSAEFPQPFLLLMWEAEKVTAMFRVQIYNRDHGPAN